MMVSLVAALDRKGVIGNGAQMPWHYSEDFAWFKNLTMGRILVIGRKTWEGLPETKLPGRRCIVMSRNPEYDAGPHADAVCGSAVSALHKATILEYNGVQSTEIIICGGAQIYEEFFLYVTKVYLTRIDAEHHGDVFFPEWILMDLETTGRWSCVDKGYLDNLNRLKLNLYIRAVK